MGPLAAPTKGIITMRDPGSVETCSLFRIPSCVVVHALASYLFWKIASLSVLRSLVVERSECFDMFTHTHRDLRLSLCEYFGSKKSQSSSLRTYLIHIAWWVLAKLLLLFRKFSKRHFSRRHFGSSAKIDTHMEIFNEFDQDISQ